MINNDFRYYDFYTLGEENEYGQTVLPDNPIPQGKVKMAIYIASQSIQDNINYSDCNYVGLTHSLLDDTYLIQYGGEILKVLYVNPKGRLKQVYLKRYGN